MIGALTFNKTNCLLFILIVQSALSAITGWWCCCRFWSPSEHSTYNYFSSLVRETFIEMRNSVGEFSGINGLIAEKGNRFENRRRKLQQS